ncbi:MAG: CoA transferase [Streptosporangiales bacterium]|nr:CoA transferase [Streptosporangiales bacterium]
MDNSLEPLTRQVWQLAGAARQPESGGGLPGTLSVSGPRHVLPSAFDVTGLASASVAAATLAAAEFHSVRTQSPPRAVSVNSRDACGAFAAERLFTPVGWTLPDVWDPVAGNYRTADGWIRLHTNYAYHRAAVEHVLGATDRDSVRAAARAWKAAGLETAVVEAGGCAAVMRDRAAWLASAPGSASVRAPVLEISEHPAPGDAGAGLRAGAKDPFGGIRVLDLTRVIAGPMATRFLAAYGADVLRIDPPGFAEVPALLPETTAGKRTAALDLTDPDSRAVFGELIREADVLVTGLRAGALDRLGYDNDTLATLNPALIHASLNAYGWHGPWRDRRGFDSLVQLSCGIAAAGAPDLDGTPVPLPVQALDHATGYLLAAAVGRALARRHTASVATRIRASLTGTADLLWSLPRPAGQPPAPGPGSFTLTDTVTGWGPARRAILPGQISGIATSLPVMPGPLGRLARPSWNA